MKEASKKRGAARKKAATSAAQRRRSSQNDARRRIIEKEGLDGYTVFSVRLRNAEWLEFADQVEKAGISNNKAMRIAARRIGGFLEIDPDAYEVLRDVTRQIGGIATNINQIARLANQTHNLDFVGFMEERQALGAEFARLEGQLQTLLNVSKRREDGLELLEKAAQP